MQELIRKFAIFSAFNHGILGKIMDGGKRIKDEEWWKRCKAKRYLEVKVDDEEEDDRSISEVTPVNISIENPQSIKEVAPTSKVIVIKPFLPVTPDTAEVKGPERGRIGSNGRSTAFTFVRL